jgi:hypothetical protein
MNTKMRNGAAAPGPIKVDVPGTPFGVEMVRVRSTSSATPELASTLPAQQAAMATVGCDFSED